MSISNPFIGHARTTDPRTPLWCAGGSIFPTTPAYKYRLGAENASGQWSFLRSVGVLFEPFGQMTHLYSAWSAVEGVLPPFQWMRLYRSFRRGTDDVLWELEYKMCEGTHIYLTWWTRVREKTNVGMRFAWAMPVPDIPGSPGLSTLYQVEFDDRLPPGGWPPWS